MVRRFGFNASLGTIDYESADTHEGAYMSDGTKEKIENERLILESNLVPHTVEDIGKAARAAADKDDFYERKKK